MNESAQQIEKPKFRGVLHQWSFILSLPIGCALIAAAPSETSRLTAVVFALSVAILLGVSALYHRVQWSPAARAKMRRLDHASIYILVSGTYTPVMVHTLNTDTSTLILSLVWGISLIGILVEVFVKRVPKMLLALTYIALGWIAIAVVSEMSAALGPRAMTLLAAGGLLYTIGGIIYGLKRPNPWPNSFGYHEIFHALVVLGIVCHYIVVAFYLWH